MKSFVWCFLLCFLVVKDASLEKHIGSRIVGGQPARTGQFPFAAALDVQTSDSKFFCGGALITNQWILSAGHCVYAARSITIRLGSISLSSTDHNTVIVATSDIFVYPSFDPETLRDDVGLVKLRMSVLLSDYIQPIKLPKINLPTTLTPMVIGWGQTGDFDSELSTELRYVTVGVITNDECRFTYGNQVTDSMVCVAGDFNEGACIGDSGSPLVVRPLGEMSVNHVGLSTFISSQGCESTDPSGYTRTFPFVGWIENITDTM